MSHTDFTMVFFSFKMLYSFKIHVNAISFMLTRKAFKKLKNYQQHDVQISYTKCHLDWTINVESMSTNPLTPPKFRSLYQFSQKSQLLNKFLWTTLVLNFILMKHKCRI